MFQTNIIMAQEQINCIHTKIRTSECCFRITLCHLMDQLWPQWGIPLAIYFFGLSLFYWYYVFILFQKIFRYQKSRTGVCFLVECCVRSWSRYGLKWRILWQLFLFLYILYLLSLLNVSKNNIMSKEHLNCLYNTIR